MDSQQTELQLALALFELRGTQQAERKVKGFAAVALGEERAVRAVADLML